MLTSRIEMASFLIKLLVVFTAFPIHEYAHAWMATKFGDDTPRLQGRLTLNPFAHLDIFGSAFLLFTGFGWAKPVQTNTSRYKNRRLGSIMVSFAGPFSNLLLALIVMIINKILFILNIGSIENISSVCSLIIILNLGLLVFNLLPIPPLDGSKILFALLPSQIEYKIMKYQVFILLGFIFLMEVTPISGYLSFIVTLLYKYLDLITGFIA